MLTDNDDAQPRAGRDTPARHDSAWRQARHGRARRPRTAGAGHALPEAEDRRTSGDAAAALSRRRTRVGGFYARHAEHLQRIVAAHVAADEATIEDACQHAWSALLRADHVRLDRGGVAWLARVAIREGWRLASTRRAVPVGVMRFGDAAAGELAELRTPGPAPDEQAIARVEHAARVRDLRSLKARERRELYLQALGYRYDEIAALTGSTYTAVNRRIAEGRAQLRRLEHGRRAAPCGTPGGSPVRERRRA